VDHSHRLASYDTSLVVNGGVDCGRRWLNAYDKKPQRYAKDNRTAHLTARSDKSVAYLTNNKRLLDVLYCWSYLQTDRHEASRGLFATAKLLVPCGSWRSKGVPSGTEVFLRILVGELGTPKQSKLAQIFAYGKWLYPYRVLVHGASDLDQGCLKTRNSEDGCTFPPNIFAPIPKITPKPHFGGPFNAKLLYGELSVSRSLMASTWRYVKIFPLKGIRRAQGPLM